MAMAEMAAPPPVLFSLQVDVESVALAAGLHDVMTGSPSVGFQLLQYELILLAELGKPSSSCCVFEADPAQLKTDLEAEEAPVTFLVLDRASRGRARLVAFAAMALDADGVAIASRLDRVCEWARERGSWPFRNHASEPVGTVSATITLSCLGRVPLPKLEATPNTALGEARESVDRSQTMKVQMESQAVSPRTLQLSTACGSNDDTTVEREAQSGLPSDKIPVTAAARETAESGVQCEEIAEDDEQGHLVAPSFWTTNSPQQMIRIKHTKKSASSVQGDCSKKKQTPAPARSIHSARLSSLRIGSTSSMYHSVSARAAEAVQFERESPPPLFFRKTKQGER